MNEYLCDKCGESLLVCKTVAKCFSCSVAKLSQNNNNDDEQLNDEQLEQILSTWGFEDHDEHHNALTQLIKKLAITLKAERKAHEKICDERDYYRDKVIQFEIEHKDCNR